uniref:Ig-like domain-containing protein n=1 Tax=Callithrix jacchus TaxID=9483 RepID=A0A8I3W822_CALJA
MLLSLPSPSALQDREEVQVVGSTGPPEACSGRTQDSDITGYPSHQENQGPELTLLFLNQVQCCLPHCAMNPGLLCWAMLCLLGAGPMQAKVTRSPMHLIQTRGQQVTLRCSPISGHTSVSWYQQAPGQGPQFIFEYVNEFKRSEGNFPGRFSGYQFSDYHSEMNISTLELGDSALYLCASSLAQPCRVPLTLCANLSASVYGNLGSDSCEKLGPSGGKKNNFRSLNKAGESKIRRTCSEDAAASGGSWQITFFAGCCTLQS